MANESSSQLMPCFKVLFLGGNQLVGKTSIIWRYLKKEFGITVATIGVDCYENIVYVDRTPIKMRFWDTCGHERYRCMLPKTLFRQVHAVIFVYSVTSSESLNDIDLWIEECKKNNLHLDSVPIMLLGNKCDCTDEIEVSAAAGRKFAEDRHMMWFETSAKLDSEMSHLNDIFTYLARILKFSKPVTTPEPEDTITVNESEKKENKKSNDSSCC